MRYNGRVRERRRHPRVTVTAADLRVTLAYDVVSVIDISIGGMKVEIAGAHPAVAAQVDVTLHLATGDVKVDAEVRHVAPSSEGRVYVGLEFDDVDLVERALGAWLREQLARS